MRFSDCMRCKYLHLIRNEFNEEEVFCSFHNCVIFAIVSCETEVSSLKRVPVRKSKDRKVFHETANKTKKLNTGKLQMRGGIRL